MLTDFEIGEKVSWMTVSGPKNGVVESIDESGVIIRLANRKVIRADFGSLNGEHRGKRI